MDKGMSENFPFAILEAMIDIFVFAIKLHFKEPRARKRDEHASLNLGRQGRKMIWQTDEARSLISDNLFHPELEGAI
jgi:hypothetical protein